MPRPVLDILPNGTAVGSAAFHLARCRSAPAVLGVRLSEYQDTTGLAKGSMGSGYGITSRCLDFVLAEHTLSFYASDAILWGAIGIGWEKAHNLVDPARPIRVSASGPNQLADLELVRHLEKTHQHGEPLEITNHGAHCLLGLGPAERGLSAALSAKVERQ